MYSWFVTSRALAAGERQHADVVVVVAELPGLGLRRLGVRVEAGRAGLDGVAPTDDDVVGELRGVRHGVGAVGRDRGEGGAADVAGRAAAGGRGGRAGGGAAAGAAVARPPTTSAPAPRAPPLRSDRRASAPSTRSRIAGLATRWGRGRRRRCCSGSGTSCGCASRAAAWRSGGEAWGSRGCSFGEVSPPRPSGRRGWEPPVTLGALRERPGAPRWPSGELRVSASSRGRMPPERPRDGSPRWDADGHADAVRDDGGRGTLRADGPGREGVRRGGTRGAGRRPGVVRRAT